MTPVLLTLAAALALPAAAAQVFVCRDASDFSGPRVRIRLAKVVGPEGDRARFYKSGDDCPFAGDAGCRTKSYIIPGDQVLVSGSTGPYACAWHQTKAGGDVFGWLAASSLETVQADPAPPIEAWAGRWSAPLRSLEIKAYRGAKALAVQGHAEWHGAETGDVRVGDVSGSATVAGAEAVFSDEVCRLALKLLGPWLAAQDNGDCGGLNVSFTGVYRRRP